MKTILFQGDSITDCGRLREERAKNIPGFIFERISNSKKVMLGKGYPYLVAEELAAENSGKYVFVNKGISGNRVPDVYARIVKDIISIKPDCMSLLIGVNDVWHGFDFNNGTGAQRFEKVYNMLIEELRVELPEMKIIILEPFVLEGSATADRDDLPDRYKKFRSGVEEMASIAKSIADKYNLKFVELQSKFDEAATKEPSSSLLSDGVHPTLKGHELIKREWIKAFKEIE